MRFYTAFAALAAPLLARSAEFTPSDSLDSSTPAELSDLPEAISNSPADQISKGSTSFELPCRADDESFSLTFEVLAPSRELVCGHSRLLLNDQNLTQTWSGDGWDWFGQGNSLVVVNSSLHNVEHNLEFRSLTRCLYSSLTATADDATTEDVVVEVTSVELLSIDGIPSKSSTGFTISFDQLARQVIGVIPEPGHFTDIVTYPTAAEQSKSVNEEDLDAALQYLEKLQLVRQNLDAAISHQRDVVDRLTYEDVRTKHPSFSKCSTAGCYFSTCIDYIKVCAKMVYLKTKPAFAPHHSMQHPVTEASCSSEKVCLLTSYKDIPDSDTASIHSVSSSSSILTDADLATDPRVLGGLAAAFFSLFCLGCVGITVKRCRDPRRRAERAARRDERRRAREYRCLERKKRARECWTATPRFLRSYTNTASDPEKDSEKRRLVQSQEALLEDVAQEEVRRLIAIARAETASLSAAEEGRAGVGPSSLARTDSIPPTYRSRAGSGRPPSYTTEDEFPSASSSTGGSVRNHINRKRVWSNAASDVTPDSSVAALSPRHSSESLRDEKSFM